MQRGAIFGILTLLLILSVPWFFAGGEPRPVAGFPVWAVWSLGVTLVFAVVTAIFISRYWNILAGSTGENADEQ